jgi:hypothetical protein
MLRRRREPREQEWPSAYRAVEVMLVIGVVTLLALVAYLSIRAAFMMTPTDQPAGEPAPAMGNP